MRRCIISGIILCFSTISLFAAVSVNLPCESVVVKQGISSTVFEGAEVYGKPGQPQLPVYKCAVLIPPDADLSTISFSVSNLAEETLEGKYTVQPASPPVSINGEWWPEERNIVDRKDVAVYSTNEFFPKSYINNVNVGKLRCYTIAKVTVSLARYNPVTGQVRQMKNGTLTVNYAKDPAYNAARNASFKVPVNVKKKVRNLVVNYNEVAGTYDADFNFTNRSKYVIMTTSDVQDASTKLDAFIASKENRGFDVEVVLKSTWGGTADNMRLWLQNNYQSMGIEYVLIIGCPHMTAGDVPMKEVTYDQGSAGSDFYFAQLSGDFEDDGIAEVDLGRIPIYNDKIDELDAILEKCTAHENEDPQNIDWRTNALLIADPLDDETPGSFMFETIKETFYDPSGWTYYRIYDDNTGNPDQSNTSMSNTVSAWNGDKFGFIQYVCHGNPTLAANILNQSAIRDLTDEYNPLVFQGTCCNGKPTEPLNIGFQVLKQSAVGVLTATENSYYYIGQTEFENGTSIQAYEYELAQAMVVDSLGAGSALMQVKSRGDKYDLWVNFCVFNLYGCPDLGVYTHAGSTPVINETVTFEKPFDIKYYNNSIHFQVPENGKTKNNVLIDLFNAQGKLIKNLLNKKTGAGSHVVRLNNSEMKLTAGLYLCRVKMGDFTKTISVVIKK